MQNLQDDNHLDRLSREAAEQYEPDQQLHSWDKLQPALDIALPQKKEKKRWFLILIFLFLLTGGGILFSAIWNNRNEVRKEAGNNVTEKTKPVNKQSQTGTEASELNKKNKETKTTSGEDETLKTPTENGTNSIDVPKGSGIVVTEENKPSSVATGKNERATNPDALTRTPSVKFKAGNKRSTADRNKDRSNNTRISRFIQPPFDETTRNVVKEEKKNDPIREPDQNLNKKDPDKSEKSDKSDKSVITTENPTPDSTIAKTQPSDTKTTDTNTKIIAAAVKPKDSVVNAVTTVKKKDKQHSALKNRWEFGLTFAPDISTVRFTHTQKPGINAGLMIGYNLTRRFSVQTGLLYTKKNYKSYGKDYHAPKGYWTDYVDLETVTGNCEMLDLPINLRYNLVPGKTSNLFVTTGLSTYFMRKEYYDYFYYYNGNPTTRSRSYPTDSKYWFSVVNISVGYEKQVSRTLSVQAEPFFKQPLKGVGFGSMKLNTTGIYFSLKYKPQIKAQKTPVKQ
ncbi:MAG TPA: porin family protein [Chitinophagaceae bacterium]